MSWDLTIRNSQGSIGSLDDLRATVSCIFPSAQFNTELSGIEKVHAAEAQGIKFPSFIRESMISRPATQGALVEIEGISMRFNFGSDDPIEESGIEVRGEGDPFPLLKQLLSVEGWQILDDSTGIALTQESDYVGSGWQLYQKLLTSTNEPI